MDGVAEGVEYRGHVEVDARLLVPDVGDWQLEVFGEGARAVHTHARGALAEVPPAGQAVATAAADDMALSLDDLAGEEVGDV